MQRQLCALERSMAATLAAICRAALGVTFAQAVEQQHRQSNKGVLVYSRIIVLWSDQQILLILRCFWVIDKHTTAMCMDAQVDAALLQKHTLGSQKPRLN